MVTYDSGTDGHYISKARRIDTKQAFPFCDNQHKKVGVANGGTSKA